jgi:hypothetical protein
VPLPDITSAGDLPPGLHTCTLDELVASFGTGTPQRRLVTLRLQRVLNLAASAGGLARIIVFGSFISAKPDPNDVDIFLIMDDDFDVSHVTGEARLVFDHLAAQPHFGASVFWTRRASCFPSEAEMVAGWGLKRDGSSRGVVEVTLEHP